jgi:hypothetical protein
MPKMKAKNSRARPTPAEWKELRDRLLSQGGGRCRFCQKREGRRGAWDSADRLWDQAEIEEADPLEVLRLFDRYFPRLVEVKITVAFEDGDSSNMRPANVAPACQRCRARRRTIRGRHAR